MAMYSCKSYQSAKRGKEDVHCAEQERSSFQTEFLIGTVLYTYLNKGKVYISITRLGSL